MPCAAKVRGQLDLEQELPRHELFASSQDMLQTDPSPVGFEIAGQRKAESLGFYQWAVNFSTSGYGIGCRSYFLGAR